MERADPPDTDDRVDEYLARVRSLPGDSVAGAFAPRPPTSARTPTTPSPRRSSPTRRSTARSPTSISP
ncbi:hypothetical protein [Halolamina pelagica]|uniref:hypothetical protein n=1 Tax=Halolamina pelagica TaxID=699431 RepID=UPI0006CA7E83|nr:hypothetical protein [Halolamina pelagica]